MTDPLIHSNGEDDMNKIRKGTPLVLLAGSLVLGCGPQGNREGADQPSPKAAAAAQAQPAFGVLELEASSFESLEQMGARSDVVAMVEVVAVKDGDVTGKNDESITTQVIADLKVDTAVKGSEAGQSFNVWIGSREESLAIGEEGIAFTSRGYPPAVGDKVLVGLLRDPRYPNLYALESNDSFFVVDDTGAGFRQDIATTNAFAKQVRSERVSDVLATLERASQ